MEKELLRRLFGSMNRRDLLAKGTALMGGAIAGLALQAEGAPAQKETTAKRIESEHAVKSEAGTESPNMHPPVVQTKAGKIAGFRDEKTYCFRSIPYADATRFELPQPVKPWDGIRNAQTWGYTCLQPIAAFWPPPHDFEMRHREWRADERCQVLNIWTPGLDSQVKRPVIVYIHGGKFRGGSSTDDYAYEGKNLSEFGDVVVVSMNHRLNILGTLDLSAYGPEYANSRYTGMADLVAALEWIHESIESFGGDPANVTLVGQESGGSKAVRMMHMPAAKGLFHKVISQSADDPAYRNTDPVTSIRTQQMIAAATLKNLGLDGNQAGHIENLKKIRYEVLIDAGTAALKSVGEAVGDKGLTWDVIADDRYVMREFCDWADSIPLVAGTVFSETVGTRPNMSGSGKNDWSQHEVDQHLSAAYGAKESEVVDEFRKCFPRKKVQDVLYFGSRSDVKNTLARKLERGKTPVWNYLFAYEYPVNGGITAFHTAEMVFVFHNMSQPESRVGTGGTQVAFALQDKMAQAWINFARTGDPSQAGLEWDPYTAQKPQTMMFDIVSEIYPLYDEKLTTLMSQHA